MKAARPLSRRDVDALTKVRDRVKLTNARLQIPQETLRELADASWNGPFGPDATPAIRDAMRLYLDTWVLPILEEMIHRGDRPSPVTGVRGSLVNVTPLAKALASEND